MSLLEDLGIIPPSGSESLPDEQTRPERELFELQEEPTEVHDIEASDAKKDYLFARNVTYALTRMTAEATHRALAVAKETEHPRAFEAFNSLAATTQNLVNSLMKIQTDMKSIYKDAKIKEDPNKPKEEGSTNSVFPTTSSDLLRIMEERDRQREANIGGAEPTVQPEAPAATASVLSSDEPKVAAPEQAPTQSNEKPE